MCNKLYVCWCGLWLQVAESRFLNNKLVEVVGFMENIAREFPTADCDMKCDQS
jgi:hypothetical protein